MLTVKQIEQEAAELREKLKHAVTGQAAINNRLRFLKQCKYYLQTNPRPEFIQQQHDHIKQLLESISGRFGEWSAQRAGSLEELQRQFKADFEIPKLKAQLKALKYLLG